MSTYLRPGVNIVENLTALTTGSAPPATAVAAFVAGATRGPVIPTLVDSWGTFQNLFGSFTNSTYLAYALYTYFQNGGTPAYVMRILHTADAVIATRILMDTAGTPLATLTVNAANAGAWGNGITIDIIAGYTAGRFNLVVHYGGAVVETFNDLSITSTDARYAPNLINSTSVFISVVDQHSATAAPANAPATQTGTALATGADGTAAVAADFVTPLTLLGAIPQPVVLNLPGADNTTVVNAQTYVATQTNTFLVVDSLTGASVSSVVSFAAALTATSFGAVYYPWIVYADPARPTSQGATQTLPPGGAVLGQYMSSDSVSGPFDTPAGVSASIQGALGLATALQPSDYDTLNSSTPPVNAIKPIPGYGICIFGGRTLQGGLPSKYIAIRRSLIYIEQSLLNLTQPAIFKSNDAALWATLTSTISAWLTAYYGAGGLAGETVAESYFVTCDSTNNTPASVAAGIVNVTVGVALEYPAEFITITIGQYQTGVATTSNSLDNNSDS